jgi:hypothetical protein
MSRLFALLSEVRDHTRIINVDESCWRIYPGVLQTQAVTGSQGASIRISGNEKDSFTVVASLTAARTKLPLCLIATGKRSYLEESHFGDIDSHDAATL